MCYLIVFVENLKLCINMMISVRYWVKMMVSLVKINWVLVGIGILVYDDLGFVRDSI